MSEHARQTISYLTRRFESVGFEPKNRFGQNFLVDLNLIDLLVRSAAIDEHDVVLEIGTGMGSLTALLAQSAAVVITVEVDRYLQQLAREELEQFENVRFLQVDALRNKNLLAPEILERVQAELAVDPRRRFKLAANLPFNVATPVLSNLLAASPLPESMTVTIQKELAERIAARPATKSYSSLSVWIQSQCSVELIRVLPPSVFWPKPKVESAIVQIVPRPELRERIADVKYFHQFVRRLFLLRRKYLRGALFATLHDEMTKPEIDRILQSLGIAPTVRAEELSVEAIIRMSDAFQTYRRAAGDLSGKSAD